MLSLVGKQTKNAHTCNFHGFNFIPFFLFNLGLFGPEVGELLDRIFLHQCYFVRVTKWEAHSWVYFRLSLVAMRDLAEQFVGGQLADFKCCLI